jgi:hypothetical protein
MHVLMFLLPAPFTWETNVQLPEILMPDHLFSHLTDFNPFSQMIFVFGTTSLLHHGFGKRPYLQIPDVVLFIFPSILLFVSFLVIVFVNFYLPF